MDRPKFKCQQSPLLATFRMHSPAILDYIYFTRTKQTICSNVLPSYLSRVHCRCRQQPFCFCHLQGLLHACRDRQVSYSRVGSRGVAAGCFLATPVATPAEGSLCPLATPGLPPGYCRAAAGLPLGYRQGGSRGYSLAASRR